MLIFWWPCLFSSRAVTRVLLAAVSVCVLDDLHLHSGVGFLLFACFASPYALNLPPLLIWNDNDLKSGHYSTVFDLHFELLIPPVHFVQATLKLSTGFLYILPRYYQVSEDMQYIALLQMLYLYCNTLAACCSPLKMTVIENMLPWKKNLYFGSSLFSTSAIPHSDLCSCKFLAGISLKSSGKVYG